MPVPWTSDTTFNEIIRLFWSLAGTEPSTISWARPSTTAVLPTPASPIKTGLFLVLLFKISITRAISLSRPITGSILPFLARAVKSVPYWSSKLLPPWPPFPPPICILGSLFFILLLLFAALLLFPFNALNKSSKSPKNSLLLFIFSRFPCWFLNSW